LNIYSLSVSLIGTVIQEPLLHYQQPSLQVIQQVDEGVQDEFQAAQTAATATTMQPQQTIDGRVIVEEVGSAYPVVEIAATSTASDQYGQVLQQQQVPQISQQDFQPQVATSVNAGDMNAPPVTVSYPNVSVVSSTMASTWQETSVNEEANPVTVTATGSGETCTLTTSSAASATPEVGQEEVQQTEVQKSAEGASVVDVKGATQAEG